jgi:hypothetical protein
VLKLKDQLDALQREAERLMAAYEREVARRGVVPREHALVPRPRAGMVPSEGE